MPLEAIMQDEVVVLRDTDTVVKVVEVFKKHSFHHIPVLDQKDNLIGMISTTDLDRFSWGRSMFINDKRQEINEMLYETNRTVDIMTDHVFTMKKWQTVEEAIQVFNDKNFRAIPIMDESNIIGLVTPLDLLNHLLKFSETS